MQRVKIKVYDRHLIDYVLVDGKNLNFKKNSAEKCYEAEVVCNDSLLSLYLDSFNPLLVPGWLVFNIIFFIITIFGIFDIRDKNKYIYNFHGEIGLVNGENLVEIKPHKGKEQAVDIFTNGNYVEYANQKIVDKRVKGRRVALFFIRFGIFLLALGALIVYGFIAFPR